MQITRTTEHVDLELGCGHRRGTEAKGLEYQTTKGQDIIVKLQGRGSKRRLRDAALHDPAKRNAT